MSHGSQFAHFRSWALPLQAKIRPPPVHMGLLFQSCQQDYMLCCNCCHECQHSSVAQIQNWATAAVGRDWEHHLHRQICCWQCLEDQMGMTCLLDLTNLLRLFPGQTRQLCFLACLALSQAPCGDTWMMAPANDLVMYMQTRRAKAAERHGVLHLYCPVNQRSCLK